MRGLLTLWLAACLYTLTRLGVLLIGVESGPAESAATAAKKQLACQFECTTTGTLTEIHAQGAPATEWTSVTSVSMGIFSDNAGAPGTLLGSAAFPEKPPNGTPFSVSGLSVAVTAGTKYWLVNVAVAGTNKTAQTTGGTATKRLSTKTNYNVVTESTEWEAAASKGPIFMWGSGTSAATGNPIVLVI